MPQQNRQLQRSIIIRLLHLLTINLLLIHLELHYQQSETKNQPLRGWSIIVPEWCNKKTLPKQGLYSFYSSASLLKYAKSSSSSVTNSGSSCTGLRGADFSVSTVVLGTGVSPFRPRTLSRRPLRSS